jgi:cytidine deaminase
MAQIERTPTPDPATSEVILAGSCGLVTAQQAQQLEQAWGMTLPQVMFALVPYAEKLAQPTISGFDVGAVALGATTGNLYFGANMEFSGQALSFTTHAEQSAITNAWLNGEQGVVQLAVSAAPCGYCRQFLWELDTAAKLGVILGSDQIVGLADLLPLPFGPNDLGVTSALMSPANNGLTISPSPTDPLVIAALAAANASYAPYSKGYAGIAVETSGGATYVGRYAENAAFNPSMSPLESALTMQGLCGDRDAIERAVLVEAASQADQSGASALVLNAVAPTVNLEVVVAS